MPNRDQSFEEAAAVGGIDGVRRLAESRCPNAPAINQAVVDALVATSNNPRLTQLATIGGWKLVEAELWGGRGAAAAQIQTAEALAIAPLLALGIHASATADVQSVRAIVADLHRDLEAVRTAYGRRRHSGLTKELRKFAEDLRRHIHEPQRHQRPMASDRLLTVLEEQRRLKFPALTTDRGLPPAPSAVLELARLAIGETLDGDAIRELCEIADMLGNSERPEPAGWVALWYGISEAGHRAIGAAQGLAVDIHTPQERVWHLWLEDPLIELRLTEAAIVSRKATRPPDRVPDWARENLAAAHEALSGVRDLKMTGDRRDGESNKFIRTAGRLYDLALSTATDAYVRRVSPQSRS